MEPVLPLTQAPLDPQGVGRAERPSRNLTGALPVTEYEQLVDSSRRRSAMTVGQAAGSIFRQDSLVDGAMAALAERGLEPEEGYSFFTDPARDELTKDIQHELLPYLAGAHSRAHAQFLRTRLLEKQEDMQRLSDFGLAGNAGRLAMNFFMPDAWLIGLTTFGVGRAVQGVRLARGIRAATAGDNALGAAIAGREVVQQAIQRQGSAGAVAAAAGVGGAENAAYEALRQRLNFEDDGGALVEAFLYGTAFTAPFALAGARSANRAATAAQEELEALQAARSLANGEEVTPAQAAALVRTHQKLQDAAKIMAGELDEAQVAKAMDEFVGPIEPPERFMVRLGDQLRTMAEDIILEVAPSVAAKRRPPKSPKRVPFVDDVPSQAELAAMNRDNPPPPKLMDLFPGLARDVAADRQWKALEEAIEKNRQDAWARFEAEDAARKAREVEQAYTARELADSVMREVDELEPPAPAPAAPEATVVAPEASPPSAPARPDPRAQQDALMDQERALRAQQQALLSKNGRRPQEGTPKAAEWDRLGSQIDELKAQWNALEDQRLAEKKAAAPAPAAAPDAASFVGQTVTFIDKKGELATGPVRRVSPTGKLVVEDSYTGELKAVAHTEVDEYPGAPAGFLPGSIGAAQVLPIGSREQFDSWGTTKVRIPGTNQTVSARFDLFAFLNGSALQSVRALGARLVKDPVGRKDFTGQDMTATEWKRHYQRKLGGNFHREFMEAMGKAADAAGIPLWKRLEFRTEFRGLTARLTRGDTEALQELPAAARPHLEAAAGAMRRTYAEALEALKTAGVKGADKVSVNDFYVNRIWRRDKIVEAMAKHGEENVYAFLAQGMVGMGRNGPLTGDIGKARSFLRVVMNLHNHQALQSVALAGRDMATLRKQLEAYQMSPEDINTIVDVMFAARQTEGADAGQAANLKFRFDIDETVRLDLPTGKLTIADLVENDAQVLMDKYLDTMMGHLGLAKVGFEDRESWTRALAQVRTELDESPLLRSDRTDQELVWLEDIHRHLLGQPMSMHSYTGTARIASALRGYSRSVMLGQLGLTAALEVANAAAHMGVRAMLAQMPSFRGFLSAVRRGYIPEPGLARSVMAMSGWGTEMMSSYVRAREISEHAPADLIGRAEHGGNAVSHIADLVSGNASFTSLTRHLSAKMATQRVFDFATGQAKLGEAARRRLAVNGLEGADLDDVLRDIKAYSTTRGSAWAGQVVDDIDYVRWQSEQPDSYDRFILFVNRSVREAIQDQDLGEMPVFAHSVIGKILTELKTFFLVAHAKQTLKSLQHFDGTSAAVVLFGMLAQSMGYVLQQAINQPDDLEERLSPERIAMAGFFRMSAQGVLPMVLETGYSAISGGDSLMQPGTTANTENRSLLRTPSYIVATRLQNLPAAATSVLGVDTATRREVSEGLKALPLSNTWGARWWVDYFSSMFPASDPEETGR